MELAVNISAVPNVRTGNMTRCLQWIYGIVVPRTCAEYISAAHLPGSTPSEVLEPSGGQTQEEGREKPIDLVVGSLIYRTSTTNARRRKRKTHLLVTETTCLNKQFTTLELVSSVIKATY